MNTFTKILPAAGLAAACLTLGTAVSASATVAAPAAVSAHAAPSPVTASLFSVTPTQATISLTSSTVGALITITDGAGITVTKKVYGTSTFRPTVPIEAGKKYDFTVTQTFGGETSAPTTVHVDSDIASLPAPTVTKTSIPIQGWKVGGVFYVTGTPFMTVEVVNAYGKVVRSASVKADGTALVAFAHAWDLTDPRFFLRQTFGDVTSPVTAVRVDGSTGADDTEQPTITTSAKDGVTTISATTVEAQSGAVLFVRDAAGNQIGAVGYAGRTGKFVLSTPAHARLVRVSIEVDNRESLAEEVILNPSAGPITPSAPKVTSVATLGSTAVVSVTAVSGAVVRVEDAAHRPVAIRIAGTTGRVSILIPGAASGTAYTVDQSTGSTTSAPTSFDVK